ncbi:unnamed protein product [Symbiodinium sp. CCMP2456]|nr:unnamed protein product [Symbiodinium sp. CCMP2456]
MKNKHGKIVSAGKTSLKRVQGRLTAVQTTRKKLGIKGTHIEHIQFLVMSFCCLDTGPIPKGPLPSDLGGAMKASVMKAKAMKKPMKAKAMKKKAVSKIAKGKRAKFVVFQGSKEKTVGGLQKSQLMKNKRGKKAHAAGKTSLKRVQGWLTAVQTARKELGIKGFCPVGGKSAQGKALYAKAKALYAA